MNKNKVQASIDKLNSSDLSKIAEVVENGNFSEEEIASIENYVDDVLLKACKTKLSLELRFLWEEQPNLALRDVVVKMLSLLPEDVEESHITILTNFVIKKWKVSPQKLAA